MSPRYIAPTIGMNFSCRVARGWIPAPFLRDDVFTCLLAVDEAAAMFVVAAAIHLL